MREAPGVIHVFYGCGPGRPAPPFLLRGKPPSFPFRKDQQREQGNRGTGVTSGQGEGNGPPPGRAPSNDVAAFLDRARGASVPTAGESARTGAVDAFVARVRATPRQGRGRLIFALDATASRQPTWDLAVETQAAMFATATGFGDLAVQLVFYRGIGECKAGPFVTRAGDMIAHMTRVSCRAGRTQIARVLRHALSVHERAPVSALVFIGDCVEEEPDELYGLAGEMGLRKLPAFIFHEGYEPTAERVLSHVARLSGGACCKFDAHGPDELRRLLAAVAAYAAGGRPALEHHAQKVGGAVLRLTHQMGGGSQTSEGGR